MPTEIENVDMEQAQEKTKIVVPTRRRPLWLLLYTVMLIVWAAGMIWGVLFTIRDIAFSGERYAIAFTIMMLIWLYIWYRLGRIVWQQWQYYAARREIIFIDEERLIIRRPVSKLGSTDAYDIDHVSPFYYSDEESCPGFQYGSRRIYFARGLHEQAAKELIELLDKLCFDDDTAYD